MLRGCRDFDQLRDGVGYSDGGFEDAIVDAKLVCIVVLLGLVHQPIQALCGSVDGLRDVGKLAVNQIV